MIISKPRVIFFIILMLILFTAPAFAGEDRYDFSIAFIGPDDPLYSWWGHVAVIVEDNNTGERRYYDYGNFSFNQDSFVRNFVMGRLYFLKMASRPDPQLRYAAGQNRDITIYNLNIPAPVKRELAAFLDTEIQRENRIYLYDHFYDNCSTRIRDIINTASGGELKKAAEAEPGVTLRKQLRRFTYTTPLMDLLLNFAMNGSIDREISAWEAMFLPMELERGIAGLMLPGSEGKAPVPFAEIDSVYNRSAGRTAVPTEAPPIWPLGLIVGLVLAAAAFILKKTAVSRSLLAVYSTLLSLLLALPGSLLFFMAVFTDHTFTYWNQNLLFVNPVLLFTAVMSVRTLINRKAQLSTLYRCWSITAAGALAALLLKAIPPIYQNNWAVILLVLPPAIVLSSFFRFKAAKV